MTFNTVLPLRFKSFGMGSTLTEFGSPLPMLRRLSEVAASGRRIPLSSLNDLYGLLHSLVHRSDLWLTYTSNIYPYGNRIKWLCGGILDDVAVRVMGHNQAPRCVIARLPVPNKMAHISWRRNTSSFQHLPGHWNRYLTPLEFFLLMVSMAHHAYHICYQSRNSNGLGY